MTFVVTRKCNDLFCADRNLKQKCVGIFPRPLTLRADQTIDCNILLCMSVCLGGEDWHIEIVSLSDNSKLTKILPADVFRVFRYYLKTLNPTYDYLRKHIVAGTAKTLTRKTKLLESHMNTICLKECRD